MAQNGDHIRFPVEVRDLTVAYREEPVLWDVDLSVPEGQLVTVVGPNGAGKSTLIKAILELVPAISGTVSIFGEPYSKNRDLVGYVPQRGSVDWDFPTTALDIVQMGLYGKIGWIRRPGRKEREIALDCMRKVGMEAYADRQISQLSGGQQQRVFLARALAQDADVYFMDEPFAGVDAATEHAIVEILRALRERGKTLVIVHHNLETVMDYFDWVVLLNVQVIASGPVSTTFTLENIRETYGGHISVMKTADARPQSIANVGGDQ
ncbi:MAG: metal ABC transporter ATP-binding protein [Chloroflexota bacterium]